MEKAKKTYERSTEGLRSLMFDAAEAILNGSMDPKDGLAIAALGKEMLHTLDTDIKVAERLESLGVGDPTAQVTKVATVRLAAPATNALTIDQN